MSLDIIEMRRKAEAGSCVNQSTLGACFLYGIDVEINYQEAFHFLSAAAKQGASRAVLNLGRMYAKGLGIPSDISEAIRCFEAIAAPSNSSDAFAARIELGRIFAAGLGVDINRDLARKWYSAALDIAVKENDPSEIKEARVYVENINKQS
jgi:hypothetical protein